MMSYEAMATDLAGVLSARVSAAAPVETLSTRGDKLLQVMQEPDGQQFVTRSFSREAVSDVERRGDWFQTSWDGMQEAFEDAGIAVVRGGLFKTIDSEYPYIAVNEYLDGAESLSSAPVDIKKNIASSMAGMILQDSPFLPSPEVLNKDMFGVTTDADGEVGAVMIDTDPHVIRRRRIQGDASTGYYLGKVRDLFWDEWCAPEERQEVMTSIVMAVADVVLDADPLGETARAFSVLHLMSNGVDTRELGLG